MKIGVDGRKIPRADEHTPVQILEHASELGMEGVYFRTVMDITPTLDLGVLREVRQRADELGLYLQMGMWKVNPYSSAEAPEVRRLGDGDYTRGMLKMMHAAREGADCGELWVACCNYQSGLPGVYAVDRFRTDAPWGDQLVAIEKFLKMLAPAARDLDVHMNLETHEEITSWEVVRLVEEVGPDVTGITFDTANVLVRGEDPVEAARRVAPYTRATHFRDSILQREGEGLTRVFSTVGTGVMDWDGILRELLSVNPDLNMSIEPAGPRLSLPIPVRDRDWIALHPDLVDAEVESLFAAADQYARRVEAGDVPSVEQLRADPPDLEAVVLESAAHLRAVLAGIR